MDRRSEGSAASRFLSGFANAVLARTLPTLREWLTARLGAKASIEHMTIDGASMRLERALVPLGPRVELEVRRAVFALTSDLMRGGAPIRLRELEGELRSVPARGVEPFRAPVWFEPSDSASLDAWVDGRLRTRNATWPVRAGVGHQAPLDGVVDLHVTSSTWSMARGDITSAAARVRLDASSVDDPSRGLVSARLVASEARAGHFVDALAALAGTVPDVLAGLPWDAMVDCELGFELDGAARIDLRVRTPSTSTLHLRASSPDGNAIEAELRGTIAALEPSLPHGVKSALAALGVWNVEVAATARGTLDAVEIEANLGDPATGLQAALALRLDGREHLHGRAHVTTMTSDVTLEPLHVRRGAIESSRLKGAVSIRDALALRWFGPGPVLPKPEGRIGGNLSLDTIEGALVLEGPVTCERLALAWVGRDHASPIVLTAATGTLRLDAQRFALRGLDAAMAGGTLRGDLSIPFEPEAKDPTPRIAARIAGAQSALLGHVIEWSAPTPDALRDVRRLAWVPEDVRCDLELAWAASNALRARVRLVSAATDASIDLKLSADGRLRGTTFQGKLDVIEWFRLERVEGLETLRLHAPLVVTFDGHASGPISDPIASLRMKLGSLALTHPSIPTTAPIRFDGVEARVIVDRQRLAWEEGAIRAYGGAATCTGVWAWAGTNLGMRARARIDGVVIERLPVRVDGQEIGGAICGRVGADVRVSFGKAAEIAASASVTIDPAALHALDALGPQLAKVDLPRARIDSVAPVALEIEYQHGDVRVESLSIDVGDAKATGSIGLDRTRRVHGELEVRLRRRWLARSALLFVPATFTGDVLVPVSLSGSLGAVKVDYDLEGTLHRVLSGNAVGRVIADVIGPTPSRPKPARAAVPRGATLSEEVVLDRVLDGVPGSDEQLVELMERGYSPHEISAKLDARLLQRRSVRR